MTNSTEEKKEKPPSKRLQALMEKQRQKQENQGEPPKSATYEQSKAAEIQESDRETETKRSEVKQPQVVEQQTYMVLNDFPVFLDGTMLRFKKKELITDINLVNRLLERGYGNDIAPFDGVECPTCGTHLRVD